MKRVIVISIVLFSSFAQAQTQRDSLLRDSLILSFFPIQWSFYFDVIDRVGILHQYDTQARSWGREISLENYDSISLTRRGDTLSLTATKQDTQYNVYNGIYYSALLLEFDTVTKVLTSFRYEKYQNDALAVGDRTTWAFCTGPTPYTLSGLGKREAVAPPGCFTWRIYQHEWLVGAVHGWVTIGGESPPAGVTTSPRTQPAKLSSTLVSDYLTRFAFPPQSEETKLRIFDLLGRERDAIQTATGSESLEYDASRLPPGMYLATLGGSAVKFIVR
jgi:hypothetical protein